MTNRLAQSQSLYLRKHAENPIDWWPWCEQALQEAKIKDKPIFLSIGYSSCHWCTVMEGEAFSDAAIANYMNANFLPIKVDREERPDIDSIYMQALQMISAQGGWPLNIFIAPDDLVPFFGGTYFPIEPRYGRPGFLQLLQAIRQYYDTQKQDLVARKAAILEAIQQSATLSATTVQLDSDLLRRGMETNTSVISPHDYGSQFPMIPYADLALRGTRFNDDVATRAAQQCQQRGIDLVTGGIFDHVGGGFHRYTVDPTWTVPHFEKMLYDNGQIVEYLANLWSFGVQQPAIERAIALTVEWLVREMTATEGYFFAAQDADSFANPTAPEPEEGTFYVWSYSELQQLLSVSELEALQQQFTVTRNGNFEGRNVLQRRSFGVNDTVETALDKLFSARYGAKREAIDIFPPARNNQAAKTINWVARIPPVTDTKMIVAWNSLMISGLARAACVFKNPAYLEIATTAANFIWHQQRQDGFYRINYEGQPQVAAQSEDYALFIKALLDLDACTPTQNDWLERAIALQAEFDRYLWSTELRGYYNTAASNSQELIVRERSYADNATPAANGVAIANLVRLGLITENLNYLNRAEQGLQAFSSIMHSAPQACPSLFTALDWYNNCTIVKTSASHLEALQAQYLPACAFSVATDVQAASVGLVCQAGSCLAPANSITELLKQIQESQTRS